MPSAQEAAVVEVEARVAGAAGTGGMVVVEEVVVVEEEVEVMVVCGGLLRVPRGSSSNPASPRSSRHASTSSTAPQVAVVEPCCSPFAAEK